MTVNGAARLDGKRRSAAQRVARRACGVWRACGVLASARFTPVCACTCGFHAHHVYGSFVASSGQS